MSVPSSLEYYEEGICIRITASSMKFRRQSVEWKAPAVAYWQGVTPFRELGTNFDT